MKKYLLLLFVATFLIGTGVAQEKKSKKEMKLEKKKAKFEAQKKAMEIGQFGFAIRKVLSSNTNISNFAFGIIYIRGNEGELDEVTWHNTSGEKVQLFTDFKIENYTVAASENGQKMTASYQGTIKNARYSFITEIAFGEKSKLQIKSSNGVEIWFTGLFETRN